MVTSRSSSPVPSVDEGQVDPFVVEGDVIGEIVRSRPPEVGIEPVQRTGHDVGPREPQQRGGVGDVDADGGHRIGDDLAVRRGPGPVGELACGS